MIQSVRSGARRALDVLRPEWIAPAVVVLTAMTVRLVFIAETDSLPGMSPFTAGLDVDLTWRGADHILAGRVRSFELSSLSAPLFPYVVAAWKWIVGGSITAFRVFLAAQSALRLALFHSVCRRLGLSHSLALLAGLALAVMPTVIYFDTVPLKTTIDITLLVAILWAATRQPETRRSRLIAGTGIGALLALLLMSQLNTFLYVVPVLVFVASEPREPLGHRMEKALPVAVIVAVVFVAFLFRSSVPGGMERFMPRAGVDMTIGLGDGARGTYRPRTDIPGSPFGHAFGARIALEAELGRPISAAESDRRYREAATRWVRASPAAALEVSAIKVALFFNNEEVPEVHSLDWLRGHSLVARLALGFGALFVLAVIGSIGLWRDRRRWLLVLAGLIGAQLAATLLTFVNWRFRVPAVVPIAILAGHGLQTASELTRSWRSLGRTVRIRRLATLLGPAAVATAFTFYPFLAAQRAAFRTMVRSHELSARDVQREVDRLAEFDDASPTSVDRALDRAMLLHELARYSEAYDALDRLASDLYRRPAAAAAYLGYLAALGDYARSDRFLRTLRARSPDLANRILENVDAPVRRAIERLATDRAR